MINSYPTILDSTHVKRRINSPAMLWLSACLLLGVAIILFQDTLLLILAAAAGLYLVVRAISSFVPVWQAFTLASLTGFILLNYGFENFVAGHVAGVPLLVGEILMFAGLALAWLNQPGPGARVIFRDPAMLCIVGLWVLTSIHLITEIPKFGLYALRDASVFFEAIFLVTGFLWTRSGNTLRTLNRWLLFVFIANLAYSCTLPLGETLQEHSPESGVFQPIALLGQYQHNNLYVVAGAFFCVWMARYVVNWKRWILITLATEQLGALIILQTRSMYIGIVLVLVVILLIGEWEKFKQFVPVLGYGVAAMVLFLVVVTASGINIQGRVTELNPKSIREYALSIFSVGNEQNRLGQDDDRLDWIRQVWTNTTADSATFVFGQGFGMPLIDFERDGIPVRQPHNSTLGVFGRLGVLGVTVWLVFHAVVFWSFVKFIRRTRGQPGEAHDFMVWLLAFYVLALVLSSVQPALEFSHCAIPLYFMLGIGLGIVRRGLPKQPTTESQPYGESFRLAA